MIWVLKYTGTLDFVTFAGGARLPAFHTCVGANDQLLDADWYREYGMRAPANVPMFG